MDAAVPGRFPCESSMNRSIAVWIVSAALFIAALGTIITFLYRSADTSGKPSPPTAEEKAYIPKIQVADAKMSVARNYLGDSIYILDANVTNGGSRTVQNVELQLEYVDTLGQVVLRDYAHAVTSRELPLRPGKTRTFQVSYDHMPADWNQAPPKVIVTRVNF
jgi:hypothetical protein